MPRLFTGFDLPQSNYQRLIDLQDKRLDVRWTPMENMHVTLRFIGDVVDDVERSVLKALEEVSESAFVTESRDVIAFPQLRAPRVIVAELAITPELQKLHEGISTVLQNAIGMQRERRPYRPHVTLARLRPPVDPRVRSYIQECPSPGLPPVQIDSFSLFVSSSGRGGVRYERIANYTLL